MNRCYSLRVSGILCLSARFWFSAVLAIVGSERISPQTLDQLRSDFVTPPAAARPWTYWFVMDGNFNRDGITADLEAMARAGLGGVVLMEVDAGMPRGPVPFMSSEWQGLFQHAVREAQRLGLQITLNAGPGWTGSGGPWIKPEQSMQHLVTSETNVTGPTRFDGVLPRPLARRPFFGPLPPEQESARQRFYQEVALLAFPTPAHGARIPDIDEKAFYLRAPYSSQPGVKPFLPPPPESVFLPQEQCIATDQVIDLTTRLAADGHLTWNVPPGSWTLLRCGRTSTGQNTRPAPQAGLGLECDKFDPTALDAHFAAFIEPLVRRSAPVQTNGAGWTMLHIDSWEMSAQNWTASFREQFRARRGYDLLNFLPVMSGRIVQNVQVSERFLWDLRQTAQELIVENHATHLKDLGRRHGFGLSIEPYDMNPCADLTLGGVADVPMCEFWSKGFGFDTDYSCFEAVSIGHTLGKPIIAAESFTSDGDGWVLHPGTLKNQGDWAFCTGINRLVVHRYQHQPWLDRRPGLTMGSIGVHWERTQTWWELVPAYHEYLARCQALLRQGLPIADICYLVPEGAPNVFRAPRSATRGDPPDHLEYNFDACAPEVVRDQMIVRNGRVALPSGMTYAVLVLPNFKTMTPRLLARIKQLVEDGATLLGVPPERSPSLTGYPECDREVRQLALQLWGETPVGERKIGQGRVFSLARAESLEAGEIYPSFDHCRAVLRSIGVEPDFESEVPLRYSHRRHPQADIYFVANPTAQTVDTRVMFRVSRSQAELWDPLTGQQRRLATVNAVNGRTRMQLRLEPYASYFVGFPERSNLPPPTGTDFPGFAPQLEILGPWSVEFQSHRGAPESIQLSNLQDLSKHSDAGVKFFSGTATYKTLFQWTPVAEGRGPTHLAIDLGDVQVMAAVTLNGHPLGPVWTPPFRVPAETALQPGANILEVHVANLWCNRLIADSGLPVDKRITWTTWNPFKPDTPLKPSGLLGPVRLLVQQR